MLALVTKSEHGSKDSPTLKLMLVSFLRHPLLWIKLHRGETHTVEEIDVETNKIYIHRISRYKNP